jgi:hypothetical protein
VTVVIVFVVLAILGFIGASVLFGADTRSLDTGPLDTRRPRPNWPGVRHCS